MRLTKTTIFASAAIAAIALVFAAIPAAADQCIPDDVIVDGSQCVGFDCVCNMNFGFDTLVLKENNLRIFFDDTSNSASFPTANWRIVANDSSNGGAEYLAFEDTDNANFPFRVFHDGGANALVVKSKKVGINTLNPVVELHVVDGDTPTLRLEQNGSSGFTPQTWDLAGNETNFFIRDVTNGSKLPFRTRPNAPTSSIDVAASGNVGLGTSSPTEALHVNRSAGATGEVKLKMTNPTGPNSGNDWALAISDSGTPTGVFRVSKQGTGGVEAEFRQRLDAGGFATLKVDGSVEATNVTFTSSREKKTDFEAVDLNAVLDKVAALEMASWRYKEGSPGRHIGPIAEDFEEVFGLGTGGKTISVVDANGVALAAIQALVAENRELQRRLVALEAATSEGNEPVDQ